MVTVPVPAPVVIAIATRGHTISHVNNLCLLAGGQGTNPQSWPALSQLNICVKGEMWIVEGEGMCCFDDASVCHLGTFLLQLTSNCMNRLFAWIWIGDYNHQQVVAYTVHTATSLASKLCCKCRRLFRFWKRMCIDMFVICQTSIKEDWGAFCWLCLV